MTIELNENEQNDLERADRILRETLSEGIASGAIRVGDDELKTAAETCCESPVNSVITFDFGAALYWLKRGKKVARKGWNGKGMFLFLLPEAEVPVEYIHTEPLKQIAINNGGTVKCLGSIRMKTTDGSVLTGWFASQTDMLAEDWYLVEN